MNWRRQENERRVRERERQDAIDFASARRGPSKNTADTPRSEAKTYEQIVAEMELREQAAFANGISEASVDWRKATSDMMDARDKWKRKYEKCHEEAQAALSHAGLDSGEIQANLANVIRCADDLLRALPSEVILSDQAIFLRAAIDKAEGKHTLVVQEADAR